MILFHGSPFSAMESFTDWNGRRGIVYFTANRKVAVDYAVKTIPGAQGGTHGARRSPTLYTVECDFSDADVFDTSKNADREMYREYMKHIRETDPEDRPDKLMDTYVDGYRVELPTYAETSRLLPWLLAETRKKASWIGEGAQGASLAVPLSQLLHIRIIKKETL